MGSCGFWEGELLAPIDEARRSPGLSVLRSAHASVRGTLAVRLPFSPARLEVVVGGAGGSGPIAR